MKKINPPNTKMNIPGFDKEDADDFLDRVDTIN
jgi:hypothetical protein